MSRTLIAVAAAVVGWLLLRSDGGSESGGGNFEGPLPGPTQGGGSSRPGPVIPEPGLRPGGSGEPPGGNGGGNDLPGPVIPEPWLRPGGSGAPPTGPRVPGGGISYEQDKTGGRDDPPGPQTMPADPVDPPSSTQPVGTVDPTPRPGGGTTGGLDGLNRDRLRETIDRLKAGGIL